MDNSEENKDFLTTQILTYIGNKRSLLVKIEPEVKEILRKLGKDKIVSADLFAGSGVVARMLKQYSSRLIVNDLENYSAVVNSCYLSNKKDYPSEECDFLRNKIISLAENNKIEGIITKNYAPANDLDIQKGERVFYTHENALLIDTYRTLIDEVIKDENLKKYFLAPLLVESSIHVNTSGVFKGFYKNRNTGIGCFGAMGRNALPRILKKIELKEPVFSNFESALEIHQENTIDFSGKLKSLVPDLDLVYLDPPYNQHPYGSNYFMLNLILKNKLDVEISRVSGITQDWKRSEFNRSRTAFSSMETIIKKLQSRFVIISYNSEGFIAFDEMKNMLEKYGKVKTIEISYNTFRGSRNLRERNIHVSEYLFVLEK